MTFYSWFTYQKWWFSSSQTVSRPEGKPVLIIPLSSNIAILLMVHVSSLYSIPILSYKVVPQFVS